MAAELPPLLSSVPEAEALLQASLGPNEAKLLPLGSYAPLWRHPLFVDLVTASTSPLLVSALPPAMPATPRGKSAAMGLAQPLAFAAELLESTVPVLAPPLAMQVQQAAAALREGAELSDKVPVNADRSSANRRGTAELLKLLQALNSRLLDLKVGGSIVVPAGWAYDAGSDSRCSTLLLALRHDSETHWSVAVCTASDGLEYHPQYREPLSAEDLTDPVLLVREVPAYTVTDTAVWLQLFRGIAYPHKSAEEGMRTLYEVLLPFLAQAPLPAALTRSPPSPHCRRRRAANGDTTRASAALECAKGLLLLSGASAAAAMSVELLANWQLLRASTEQMRALAAEPRGSLSGEGGAGNVARGWEGGVGMEGRGGVGRAGRGWEVGVGMGGRCGDGRAVWAWEGGVGMEGRCGDGRTVWGWKGGAGMGGRCGGGRAVWGAAPPFHPCHQPLFPSLQPPKHR